MEKESKKTYFNVCNGGGYIGTNKPSNRVEPMPIMGNMFRGDNDNEPVFQVQGEDVEPMLPMLPRQIPTKEAGFKSNNPIIPNGTEIAAKPRYEAESNVEPLMPIGIKGKGGK